MTESSPRRAETRGSRGNPGSRGGDGTLGYPRVGSKVDEAPRIVGDSSLSPPSSRP